MVGGEREGWRKMEQKENEKNEERKGRELSAVLKP